MEYKNSKVLLALKRKYIISNKFFLLLQQNLYDKMPPKFLFFLKDLRLLTTLKVRPLSNKKYC